MALKKTAAKSATHAHHITKPKRTASKELGADVKKITRPYLSPLGKSEVGVSVIRKAVRQAAKEELKATSNRLKKAAKAL